MSIKKNVENAENLVEIVAEVIAQYRTGQRLLVAIDGRCASGKTTLAKALQKRLPCEVIHMDHFFLQPWQRTRERLDAPGENVDHERFLQQVLEPLEQGKQVCYQPFDCKRMELGEPVQVEDKPIYIIEGAYACHRLLQEYYDLRIFLSVSSEEQLRRIILRNGASGAEQFKTKWIPMEERYFEAYGIADLCDYCFTVASSEYDEKEEEIEVNTNESNFTRFNEEISQPQQKDPGRSHCGGSL